VREDRYKRSFSEFRAGDPNRLDDKTEHLATAIVDVFVEVHRHLGPGHLEATYEAAVCHELSIRGMPFQRQFPIDVYYKGVVAGKGFVDILVDQRVVVELKAVEQVLGVHRAQVGSYLAAIGIELGLLANFNVELMKDGIKRIVRTRR
jgi:GxxExxY protein